MWHVDVDVQPDRTIHVWPDEDILEHELYSMYCLCWPEIEEIKDIILVSHKDEEERSNRRYFDR